MSPHRRVSSRGLGRGGGEGAAATGRAGGGGRVGDGGLLPPPRGAAVAVDRTHQARHPFAGTPLALVSQLVVDSRGSIGLFRLVVDLDDLLDQLGVTASM